jgi:hypothetical protein
VSRLGRQAQARNHGSKGVLLSRSPQDYAARGLIPAAALAMPIQSTCPQPWGERVGGVRERPTPESGEERSPRVPGSQRWKAPWSTRRRQPSRDAGETWALAGPSRPCGARSRAGGRTGDNRCPLGAEEGNVVGARQARALGVEAPKKRPPRRGHVLRSVQRPVHVNRLSSRRARSFRYRGRANLRKQEEPAPGSERTDELRGSPRVTASLAKVVRDASEKEGGHGLRPSEETRAPVLVRTSCFSCRSRQAASWSRISSHAALQKEWR